MAIDPLRQAWNIISNPVDYLVYFLLQAIAHAVLREFRSECKDSHDSAPVHSITEYLICNLHEFRMRRTI